MEKEEKQRTVLLFLLCVPVFIAVGYFANKAYDARGYDFAAYWQAAYMVLDGKDVYNADQWISVRTEQQTALHSEVTFQYPLPLAVLMSPLAILPVGDAYTVWLLFGQIAILVSILLLFKLQAIRLPFFEIVVIAMLFLFRPMYTVILSGQILAVLLFFATIAMFSFYRERWFMGGLLVSFLSLKPSIGLPILLILGLWLLARKSWKAILGVITGCFSLFLAGAIYNPFWVFDYLAAGQHLLTRYVGMHSTLWGIATLLFQEHFLAFLFAGTSIGFVLVTMIRLFFYNKLKNPFAVMAVVLARGLLVAPYSWSYDQILLLVPLFFIINEISKLHGYWIGFIFLFGVIVFAASLALMAYSLQHDVWSVLVTIILWGLSIYFAKKQQSPTKISISREKMEFV